jgi:hypothetical protein
MAKKAKKEAVKPEEPKSTPAKEKGTVARAAEKVVEVVKHAAEAVNEHVIQPVVKAVRGKPKKKARFVRQKNEKRPHAKPALLPPRSTKATAKLMTKGIATPPKEEPASGQKPRA